MEECELLLGMSTEMKVETLQESAGRAVGSRDAEGSMTIPTVKAGPEIFIPEEIETEEPVMELERAITEAVVEGLPPKGIGELKEKVL